MSRMAIRRKRRDHDGLREQAGPHLGILDEDGTDWTVLRRLQDFRLRVARGVDGLRLAVGIEAKHRREEGFAHGIPHTPVVIHPHAQGSSHHPSSRPRAGT